MENACTQRVYMDIETDELGFLRFYAVIFLKNHEVC